MSSPAAIAPPYAAALEAHLRHSGEQALHQAYELGRQAMTQGLGVLDLTLTHHEALAGLMNGEDRAFGPQALERAAQFLAEVLSPFEMMLRGYHEANLRLQAEMEERRKAEEQLLEARKLQAIGLLAGGVAHHFNNLLTVVLGNLELARRRVAGDERVERLLLAARSGAERGADVTRQLLSFSRQQMLQPRPLAVAAWLANTTSLLASALRGDIAVEVQADGDLAIIEVDPAQLELALLNLAVNARDAMPAGGLLSITARDALLVEPRLGLEGRYVVIEVADTGEGVPADVLPQVFEPFFSTKDQGPGAGLGLSQVHGFAHQSGGAVEMENRPGGGALVRLYLPASSKSAPATILTRRPALAKSAAAGRVLVVEDDLELAELVAELLQSLGYSVTLADRAQAALDLISSGEPIDLVFSDVVMPGGMNGVQLARELAARSPQTPVLLTSGYNDAVEDLDSKGLSFIPKPYRPEDLQAGIDRLLGARRSA